MKYQVENGGARPPKVERGASVVHRKDTKQQKAAKAADVYDGLAVFQPTQGELAYLYGVSVALINRARQLPPERRKLVAAGRTRLSSPARVQTLPKPATSNGKSIDDAAVFDLVRNIGIEKVLTIAAAVEQAQHR
jgi:hypothetical protein